MSRLNLIADDQIPQVLARAGLTVILLTASWDGNGIIMRSLLEQAAERFPDVYFYQGDYETAPQLARLFNLLSPPGLLFIQDGELVQRVTKPVSARTIQDLLQAYL